MSVENIQLLSNVQFEQNESTAKQILEKTQLQQGLLAEQASKEVLQLEKRINALSKSEKESAISLDAEQEKKGSFHQRNAKKRTKTKQEPNERTESYVEAETGLLLDRQI